MIEKARISTTNSFVLGLAAGAVAIAVSLLMRSFAGGPFIPEVASQTLFSLTPGQFESRAVESFGPLAKYSAFTGAIIINFILYGLFAVLLTRLHNKFHWKGYLGRAALASVVAYVILLIIVISLVTITESSYSHTGNFYITVTYLPHSASDRLWLYAIILLRKDYTTIKKTWYRKTEILQQRSIIRKELYFVLL